MKSPLEHPRVLASVGEELVVGGSWPRDTLTPTAAIAQQLPNQNPNPQKHELPQHTIYRRWHSYRMIITEESRADPRLDYESQWMKRRYIVCYNETRSCHAVVSYPTSLRRLCSTNIIFSIEQTCYRPKSLACLLLMLWGDHQTRCHGDIWRFDQINTAAFRC